MRRTLWSAYPGYGVLAALVGIAAGHLVAALVNPAASPVLAVGSAVIDLTPTPVKEWAVARLGSADKPVLVGSVLVATLVAAGAAGVLARASLVRGAALLVTLVGLAGVAALIRPAATPADALPAIAAAAAALGSLAWLTGLRRPPIAASAGSAASGRGGTDGGTGDGTDTGPGADSGADRLAPRRRTVMLLGAGAVAAAAAGQWIGRVRSRLADIALPTATEPAGPFPRGLEADHDGISALRTPTESFYRVDTRLIVPSVDVDDWTLTVDGDVERPLGLTFAELIALPLIERDITLNCVSNAVGGPYISSARWLGVRLTDLLDRAGVGAGADQLLSTDVDGFTISTPLAAVTDGRDAMVVVGMNGGPLPRDRGFPCRLLVPGLYGFVGATKWLRRLTLTTYDAESAYWTQRGWAIDAPVKVASRIDTPRALADLDAGRVVVGGVAWAQRRGIARVEVRVDGGAWQEAELGPRVGVDYWRQWFWEWEATTGRHDLAVRATTEDGEVQIEERATPFPDGASGWQSIAVRVS